MRRGHDVVAAVQVEVADVVLELLAEDPAARMPHVETAAELVRAGEEIELAPQLAVIAAFRLLQSVQVRVELLLRRPRRAVDPLELRAGLVAPPVRPRHREQLEHADPTGRRDVRAEAEVRPSVVPVHGHTVPERSFLRLDAVDDLPLERLVRESLQGVVAFQLLTQERLVLPDEIAHALLDPREVVGRERLVEIEVVVEAVLDGRADRVPRSGEQVAHRLRHHVRGGVAQDTEAVGLGAGHRLHADVAVRDPGQVDQAISYVRCDRTGRKHGTDGLPFWELRLFPVVEGDARHAGILSACGRGKI